MENRDRFGHVIPEMEKEIMAHFDTLIRGNFGNTPAILLEASKDLAADNAAAAQTDYGRTATNKFKKLCESLPCETSWGDSLTPAIAEHIYDASHSMRDFREAALKAQIDKLIMQSNNLVYRLSHKVNAHEPINSTEFINMTGDLHKEIDVAMELVK